VARLRELLLRFFADPLKEKAQRSAYDSQELAEKYTRARNAYYDGEAALFGWPEDEKQDIECQVLGDD